MDLDINKESVDDNRGHTHDHVCYSLKVHQGLECLQVIQGVSDPVITVYLWHAELTQQGEGVDGRCERRVSSVDKVVKITRHPPLESVHHNLHLFFHRLHLCNDRWRSRNCEGREAHVLSLQSAWGVTGLGSLLVSSVSAGSLLISSLVVRCCVFWRSCFSRSRFCLVRRSTATTKVLTYFSRAVVGGSSS